MNSYQRIKDYIFTNLQKQGSPLPDDQIKKDIEACRGLISKVGIDLFAQILPIKEKLTELTDEDWSIMEKELETQFDVKMELGSLIDGDSESARDKFWWSSKKKHLGGNYYWDRYKSYLLNSLNKDIIKTIDDDTDRIMNNLEDPDISTFSRYGMVVGHVQSGKTGNYSALICKAADAGYKFIVVIAGGMDNLRDQTQARLNEYFIGKDSRRQIGVGIGTLDRGKLPISLTTKERDFNKQDADKNSQGLNFDNINVPILLVIKKNTNSLKNVIDWLENQYRNKINHEMLLIDDESDYASINTKEEQDPTTINKRIRKLLSLFQKSVYVAYTATPYANIFIDHQVGHNELGQDLFPKDFIYALDAPKNYMGAEKIFTDPEKKHLIAISDFSSFYPKNHKKDRPVNALPESLRDAIRHFLLNIAIRHLRGQSDKHNSMLVHVSRFTNIHRATYLLIEQYLDQIKSDVRVFGMLKDATTQSEVINDLKSTFTCRLNNNNSYEWQSTLTTLTKVISSVLTHEVHQNSKVPLVYRNDIPTNSIVVGGTSLSRGYTLEGLSISYFLRSTIYYDTLMQMGRWFGYRTGYEDLCKIYLPEASINSFEQIILATLDLFHDFKRMAKSNMTPYDFGLAVKHHPDSGLQVTARNKQKNAKDIYFDMSLDGKCKETSWLPSDEGAQDENIELTISTIKRINASYKFEKVSNTYVWKNVEREIVIEFLNKFKVYDSEDELGVRTRMPIKFIRRYAQDIGKNWDIALYSGLGDEVIIDEHTSIKKGTRQFIDKGDYIEVNQRQISTGSAESVVLRSEKIKVIEGSREEIRAKIEKPLLMLHILQNIKESPRNHSNSFAAFGASFPINKGNDKKTIKLKINKVYLNQLLENSEDDYDD